jgi:polysaccharide export outer membrane protein
MAAYAAILLLFSGCATLCGSTPTASKLEEKAVTERTIVPTRELYSFPSPSPLAAEGACPTAPAPVLPPVDVSYRIGPGDLLNFQIFDEPALSRQVVVRYDGKLSLPLIDDLDVNGLTREEAEARVRESYKQVFKSPRLTLTVDEVRSKSFFVFGEVEEPSEYIYRRPLSLLAAITIAGGVRVDTNGGDNTIGAQGQLTKAFIIREVNGKREVKEYDLKGLRNPGEHPSQVPVLPNDFVYVPEGVNLVYVVGEVNGPSVYPLLEQMTVLQLLARAGGAIEWRAKMRRVVLLRQKDATHTEAILIDLKKALRTGISPVLCPGDILYVPRGDLVRLYDNLMRFTILTQTVAPILDLYMQAYDAYYTDREFDELFEDEDEWGTSPLEVLETIQNFSLTKRKLR